MSLNCRLQGGMLGEGGVCHYTVDFREDLLGEGGVCH